MNPHFNALLCFCSSGTIPNRYPCETQSLQETKTHKSSPSEINLGWKGVIPRWKAGSVIKWAADPEGYVNRDDASYAEARFAEATQTWNKMNLGVSFAKADPPGTAAFIVRFNGDNGDTLAEAFFPNTKLSNNMYVYSRVFEDDARPDLVHVFEHELGHVLGLRHEFAAEEGDFILFGRQNLQSVMAYNWPPRITPQDVKETQEFYAWCQPEISSDENTYKVVDHVPRGGK